jgi:DNA-directed RNA polymerase specialized sigma24 family protein
VAGAFDEWAAARTPSLLRFAHALTEDGPAAEAATQKALERTRKAWSDVERGDDPDLLARKLLIDSRPGRRRAAAVLRVLEDRSDAEIAEVLGTSHAFARAQVQRGLATLQDDLPAGAGTTPGDNLHARATTAPTQLARPLASTEAPRRRNGRAIGVSVVAVLVLVVTVAGVSRATRSAPGVITYPTVHAPADWRYESYDGVQVQVPATWGYGGAPMQADFLHGRLAACGANQASVLSSADTATYVTSATPFVGRPSKMTDACVPWGSDGSTPTGTAVWFASPLPVGVKSVGAVVAETRAIGGQHVTVFAGQSALRRQILGTAEVLDVDANGCPTRAVQVPAAGPASSRPSSLSVCVYSQDTGTSALLWSGRLDADTAQTYADAVRHAGHSGPACSSVPTGRWVALGLHGDTGTRWDVVDLRCGAIERPGGTVLLTPATVRDWAKDGVTAYAVAPAGLPHSVASYFHTGVS